MSATDLKSGDKIQFTPTGRVFEISKVTDSRISWHLGFSYKGGNGVNNLKMTCITLKSFQEGLDDGSYKFIKQYHDLKTDWT